MGAWGVGSFENDMACDWGYGLEEVDDLSLIIQTLDTLLGVGDAYLEAMVSEEAVAAAEVIARLQGSWGPRDAYTETVDRWVERVKLEVPPELALKARQAIDRILCPPSELLELWQESDDYQAWRSNLEALKERVAA